MDQSAQAWIATGPPETRFSNVTMRIVALRLASDPRHLKVSIQTVEGGKPLAEDPITVVYVDSGDLDAFLENSRATGWTLKDDPTVYTEATKNGDVKFHLTPEGKAYHKRYLREWRAKKKVARKLDMEEA